MSDPDHIVKVCNLTKATRPLTTQLLLGANVSVCYRLYFRIKKAFSKFTGIKATLDTRGGEFCIGK
jgi:hypothetical protein